MANFNFNFNFNGERERICVRLPELSQQRSTWVLKSGVPHWWAGTIDLAMFWRFYNSSNPLLLTLCIFGR